VCTSAKLVVFLLYLTFERLLGPSIHGVQAVFDELRGVLLESLANTDILRNSFDPAPPVSRAQNNE
jgi:hypothetical protein